MFLLRLHPARHEASEGAGAAGEEPERAAGETGEVQRAGTDANETIKVTFWASRPKRNKRELN